MSGIHPRKQNRCAALLPIRCVLRKDTGRFISIGFQQPHFRLKYLSKDRLGIDAFEDCQVFKIDAGLGYFYTRAKPSF